MSSPYTSKACRALGFPSSKPLSCPRGKLSYGTFAGKRLKALNDRMRKQWRGLQILRLNRPEHNQVNKKIS